MMPRVVLGGLVMEGCTWKEESQLLPHQPFIPNQVCARHGIPCDSVPGYLCIRIICWDVRSREVCGRVSGALEGPYRCGFTFRKIWGPYGVGALERKVWIYP